MVAALVPVSEEVCRSVDVYQRGKLLTLELKTGTLLKLGVRFKVTLVLVNLLLDIGNVIWVEAYHYFQVLLLIIGAILSIIWYKIINELGGNCIECNIIYNYIIRAKFIDSLGQIILGNIYQEVACI